MIHRHRSRAAAAVTAVIILATSATLRAREWQAWLGMQSRDGGSQALALLPNELWVHTGDSVRWTMAATEIHTVTFLQQTFGQPGQARPPLFSAFGVQPGCPGMPVTPDGSSFDGSKCVNSGVMGTFDTIVGPQSYSVKFPGRQFQVRVSGPLRHDRIDSRAGCGADASVRSELL